MFKNENGFLQDSKGNYSVMRLAFIWLILNATFMGWYIIIDPQGTVAQASTIFGTVTGVATGLKLMQNQQEKDKPQNQK